jgi:hypothetical protein
MQLIAAQRIIVSMWPGADRSRGPAAGGRSATPGISAPLVGAGSLRTPSGRVLCARGAQDALAPVNELTGEAGIGVGETGRVNWYADGSVVLAPVAVLD